MEMAEYIMQVLKTNLPVVWSWGFNSPIVVENGLRFNVEGFKHTGKVEIVYMGGKDLFDVMIINSDGSVKETIEDVYLDQLVDVIDRRVELVDDYQEKVKETYMI